MKKRVLLLNPPFFNRYSKSSRSPAVTKSGTIYYPLWLCYAAGVLDRHGHEIKIIDCPAKCLSYDLTLDMIKTFKPDLVVIDTSTASINNDLMFAKSIKDILTYCYVCLVGTHASACDEEILPVAGYIDYVARHEYDFTLPELLDVMDNKEKCSNIKGISYMYEGKLIRTPDRPFYMELDNLPFVSEVYYKYLDIKDYFYAHVAYPTVSIFSSRGCPSRCFYCMYSQVMFGKKYRKRSAKNLYDECLYIKKTFPDVKEILIDDDNFAVDQENVKEFCRLMIEGKVKLKWIVQVRVTLQYETMLLMKKAGCKLIVAGFESGNQQILDNMHKDITLEQSVTFSNAAKKAHLRVHGCFMVGNPGENKHTMQETLDFALKLHLDTVQFFPLMVYPGTEAFKWAKDNGYIKFDNYDSWLLPTGEHNCVLTTSDVSNNEFVNFCKYARRKFYIRPKYISYKIFQCLKSKDDFVKTWRSFRVFGKYLFTR